MLSPTTLASRLAKSKAFQNASQEPPNKDNKDLCKAQAAAVAADVADGARWSMTETVTRYERVLPYSLLTNSQRYVYSS
jgi:hypothetical protein